VGLFRYRRTLLHRRDHVLVQLRVRLRAVDLVQHRLHVMGCLLMSVTGRKVRQLKTAAMLTMLATSTIAVLMTSALPSSTQRASSASADARIALADLSEGAADAAAPVPAADEYLYKEILLPGGKTGQFWISIDGQHDGLMIRPDLDAVIPLPGCIDGRQVVVRDWVRQDAVQTCTPIPTFDPALPSDADSFRHWLLARVSPEVDVSPEIAAHIQAKATLSMLTFTVLTADQRAAILAATAMLPGINVEEGAVDALGRSGTKISWEVPGPAGTEPYRGSILLDNSTYELLESSDELTVIATAVVAAVGETR
jgi:hypothetical protein